MPVGLLASNMTTPGKVRSGATGKQVNPAEDCQVRTSSIDQVPDRLVVAKNKSSN